MEDKTITFNSPGGWVSFLVLLSFMVLWILWFYRRLPRPASTRMKLFLGALRLAAVAVVLFLWLRPAMKTTVYEVKKPLLVFLIDDSRSMRELRDGPEDRSRSETVRMMLDDNQKMLERLADRYDVLRLRFAKTILAGSDAKKEQLDASNYGDSLDAVRQRAARSGCAGAVIIGDGCSNFGKSDPVDAAIALGNQEIPVYTVGIGNESPAGTVRDIKVVDLKCPQVAYLYSKVPVEGKVVMQGFKGETVEVKLSFPDMEPQTRKVTAVSDNESIFVQFEVEPEREGEFKLSLRAQWLKGEILDRNNVSSTYLKVVKGGLKVGYFDRLRPESKFIAYALGQAQQINLIRVVWPAPDAAYEKEALNWSRYDVVIIGDVTAVSFGKDALESLAESVRTAGKGVLLLVGEQSGGRGGFAGSELEKALPVVFPEAGVQWLPGPAQVAPAAGGLSSSILQILEGKPVQAAWAALEPVDGVFTGLTVKRSGSVTLKFEETPVLAVQSYGLGRAACLAVNTTYRWFFTQKDTQDSFLQFWRQLLLWTGGFEDRPKSSVWISLPKRRWQVGDTIPVKVLVTSEQGAPAPDAQLELKVKPEKDGPERTVKTSYSTKDGAFMGSLDAQVAGDYQLSAAARLDGKLLGEDSLRFVVEEFDRELDQPVADHRLLRRLAATTESIGGKFVQWQRFNWLLSELYEKGKRVVVPHTELSDIWDRSWVFALFFALVVTDWVVRKAKGLV